MGRDMIVVLLAAAVVNLSAKYVEPIGIGADKCHSWVQHHDANDASAKTEDQWLAGYLSGFNTWGRMPLRKMTWFRYDLKNVSDAVTRACRNDDNQDVFLTVTHFVEWVQKEAKPRRRR